MIRQRGAALLITVLIIFGVAIFGAIALGSMAGGDITDSSYQSSSGEALYAAETGIERSMKVFAAAAAGSGSTTCLTGLATTQAVATGRTFAALNGLGTDFSGVSLPSPDSQCRVRVSGTVTSNNTTRSLQALVDRSLLAGYNPAFNTPPGTGTATVWAVTARGQDYTGGPDPSASAPTSCSRAIYSVKARDAAGNVGATLATATLSPGIAITAGTVVTVRFNYRAIELATGDAACAITDAGVANPGNANDVQIRFSVTDNAGVPLTSFTNTLAFNINTATNSLRTPGRNVTSANSCRPTTQQFPANYASCATFYQAGTPASKGALTLTILGAGARTLVSTRVYIYLRQQGNAREAWVDNVEFIAPTVTGVVRTTEWRDCAVSNCP